MKSPIIAGRRTRPVEKTAPRKRRPTVPRRVRTPDPEAFARFLLNRHLRAD